MRLSGSRLISGLSIAVTQQAGSRIVSPGLGHADRRRLWNNQLWFPETHDATGA